MGRKGELTPVQVELRVHFSEGLYRARRWDEARAFAVALESVPERRTVDDIIKRIDSLATTPPGDGWDGSWHLEQK